MSGKRNKNNKKLNESQKKALDYLMSCDLSESESKSDSIRSKLFQLIANRDVFKSEEEFNAVKHQLMTELNDEMDRSDGKNTFLSQIMVRTAVSEGQEESPFHTFESQLYHLNGQQLCRQLNLKPRSGPIDDSNDCRVIGIVMNSKDSNDINTNESTGLGTSAQNSGTHLSDNRSERSAKSLLERVGSYKKNIFGVKRTTSASDEPNKCLETRHQIGINRSNSLTSSPTRVSGIFKTNSPKDKTNNRTEEMPPKHRFITGFEKKLVDDVKSGSIDLSKARNVLKQIRQPFVNPLKMSEEQDVNPHLKNIDPNMIATIENEIISALEPIEWSDVAGLGFAKNKIKEIAIFPLLRPDLFRGLRKPPKGILLFGPPGTGKTLIGKCIATQTKSTFFSITVSALNSKWIGEGEKMIRAMFGVARSRQPAVIFIDEIDSLLKSRCESEHESSRRMKTEFLAQFEGVATDSNDRLLIVGATNRPQELDDAARRRLTARLYIRLPHVKARQQLIRNLIKSSKHCLSAEQIDDLAEKTDGYSGADISNLCYESAMQAVRDLALDLSFDAMRETNCEKINEINEQQIRDISYEDFIKGLDFVKPSVSKEDLNIFEEWNHMFGTNDSNK